MSAAAVWKFPLRLANLDARPVVAMPLGARVLACHVLAGEPTVWAQVDPDAEIGPRRFALVGTGTPFDPAGLRYIATVQLDSGDVLHVFEDLRPGDGQ